MKEEEKDKKEKKEGQEVESAGGRLVILSRNERKDIEKG